MQKNKTTLRGIKDYFPLLMQVFTVAGLLLATYITVRLVPLYQDIDRLNFRVLAIEHELEGRPELVQEFRVSQKNIESIEKNIGEIKQDIRDIKNFLNVR